VEAALDAAERDFGINRMDFRVEAVEERRWPSTALGCPQPGRSYAQIIVSGLRVVLRVDGELVAYHVDDGGLAVVRCDVEERDEP
jgi:hypothetical protein